jgi:hypothetical protein
LKLHLAFDRYLNFGANDLTIFLFVGRMNQFYVGANGRGANDLYTSYYTKISVEKRLILLLFPHRSPFALFSSPLL